MEINPSFLSETGDDVLFHLGYALPGDMAAVQSIFGDVKFVILAGSTGRTQAIMKEYEAKLDPGTTVDLVDLCLTDRYNMYKSSCGRILALQHGMGIGSMLILLHELAKALFHAQGKEYNKVPWIRIGSCGGVSTPAGTVIVTRQPLNSVLEPVLELPILGRRQSFPVSLDRDLSQSILSFGMDFFADAHEPDQPAIKEGNTFCCVDFYEAQGRRDGAICRCTEEEQKVFLRELKDAHGVANIEMESLALGYVAECLGIPAAVVCVVLVNRTCSDQVVAPIERLKAWEGRPVRMVIEYVYDQLDSS